jgi:dynein heavy chain 1
MYQLLIVQALRPDRLLAMTSIFVSTVMGEEFLHEPEQELDLTSIVENEVRN